MSDTKRPFPSIPMPTANVESILRTVMALKDSVEILTNQKGDGSNAAVLRKDKP